MELKFAHFNHFYAILGPYKRLKPNILVYFLPRFFPDLRGGGGSKICGKTAEIHLLDAEKNTACTCIYFFFPF